MKKIYYLFAFAAFALTACQKEPALHSVLPLAQNQSYQTLSITLQKSDYQELPSSNYAYTSLSFKNSTDAQNGIAQILTAEYPSLADNSTAAVTYTQTAAAFSVADSTLADVTYTLTNADYLLLPGNKYNDFSLSQLLAWLPYKYTSPASNMLEVLSWNFYPKPTAKLPLNPPLPYSFLYTGGVWRQIYTVDTAQYISLGLGKYDQFTSANDATLPQTLGALVKNDVTVMDTIKKGDMIYVSFGYYNGGDFQRALPLVYDGTNFASPSSTSVTINFKKTNGTWAYVQPLPVVTHTLTAADITLIANSGTATGASSSLLSNLGSYGDFETSWTSKELDAAFILVLQADYTTPATNTNYQIVYKLYTGGSDVNTIYTFQWSGTAWVAQQ